MKQIATKLVFLMTSVFLLTAVSYSQQILKADVPFDFTAGKKSFPAGEYTVTRTSPQILSLRSSDGGNLMVFLTEPLVSWNSHTNAKLKFEAIGGQYVLTEVWPEGASNGYELLRSKRSNYIAQIPSGTEGQTTTSTYVGK